MLPSINEEYADFVLTYAKKDGLDSIVRKLEMNETNSKLKADLQPFLIDAFATKFPDVNLIELDKTVEWILIKSAVKLKRYLNDNI